jgi:hypothetical protein
MTAGDDRSQTAGQKRTTCVSLPARSGGGNRMGVDPKCFVLGEHTLNGTVVSQRHAGIVPVTGGHRRPGVGLLAGQVRLRGEPRGARPDHLNRRLRDRHPRLSDQRRESDGDPACRPAAHLATRQVTFVDSKGRQVGRVSPEDFGPGAGERHVELARAPRPPCFSSWFAGR